jgi:hypothetical protein
MVRLKMRLTLDTGRFLFQLPELLSRWPAGISRILVNRFECPITEAGASAYLKILGSGQHHQIANCNVRRPGQHKQHRVGYVC